MQPFFLQLYRALPASVPYDLETLRTDGIGIDPRRTSLQWSTQLPGGWGSCTAGFEAEFTLDGQNRRTAWLDRSVECPPQGHLQIVTCSGAVVYGGRRAKPAYAGAALTEIEAHGYGTDPLDDLPMTALPSFETTGLGALRYALGTLSPPLPLGNVNAFVDPGVPHNLTEWTDATPLQVVNQLTKEGGGANVLFDLLVYEDRIANFLPRLLSASQQPDYLIPFDRATVKWSEDDGQLYDYVKVTYTTPATASGAGVASSVEARNAAFYTTYGFHRGKIVPGGTMTAVGAAQFAATWLALHGQPWVSATVTRSADRGLELYAGMAERPAFYARAGQWCQVGTEPPLIAVNTTYTAHADSFTMTLGQPAGGFLSMMSNVIETSSATRRGINPNSSAAA